MKKNEVIKKRQEFLEKYKQLWTITGTARAININPDTVYNWIEKDREFKKQIEKTEKELFDYVKSKLLLAIKEGNLTAIIFFLKTRHPEFQQSQQQTNMMFAQQNILNNQINIKPGTAKKLLEILEEEITEQQNEKTNNEKEIADDNKGTDNI